MFYWLAMTMTYTCSFLSVDRGPIDTKKEGFFLGRKSNPGFNAVQSTYFVDCRAVMVKDNRLLFKTGFIKFRIFGSRLIFIIIYSP